MTLFEVAAGARPPADRRRSCATTTARRPVYGGTEKFQDDPHWRDLILFYEYFHGDNGAGLGASHQTGWTGLVAPLIQLFGHLTPRGVLEPEDRPLAQAVPPGHRRGDRPTSRRPARREASTREAAAEPASSTRSARGSGCTTWRPRPGRPVTLGDVPDEVWDAVAGAGVDAVWLMGVWQRSPAGAAIARDQPGDGRRAARGAARPHRRRRRRLGLLHPRLRRRRAPRRRRRAGRGPRRAGGARRRADPRLRAQPRRARPPVGGRAPGVVRPRHGRGPRRRSRQLPRRRRRRDRPRPRPVLPGRGRRCCSSTRRGRTLRAAAADDGRGRSPSGATACAATWRCSCSTTSSCARGATGRPAAPSPDGGRGLLADRHRRRAGRAPRLRVLGRGLLGPRAAPRRAGLRRLLRQAALRPARARRGRPASIRDHLARRRRRTRRTPCASSRTTTSRGWPRCSRAGRPRGPRPSSPSRCPASRCSTRARRSGGGSGCR